MKKIINGKVYDTDTAKAVGEWSNGLTWRDFGCIEETLYKKRTGEYFLFGEGGAMTGYAERVGGNGYSGGSRIMPYTFDEAKRWCEEKLTAEGYEAEFGAVAEDESRRQICISISTTASETLKRRSSEAGLSVSAYIESLII